MLAAMARSRFAPLLALLALAAVAWGIWLMWPGDERRIQRRLAQLEKAFNEPAADGLGLVARTAQLAQFFTEDVVVDPGRRAGPIVGRERLLALASRAPNSGGAYRLDFVDVSVHVEGEAATSDMTATLALRDPDTGEDEVDAREVRLEWRRGDEWRITRIALVEALERP
jgi:ketosteroid isomerase-like protein